MLQCTKQTNKQLTKIKDKTKTRKENAKTKNFKLGFSNFLLDGLVGRQLFIVSLEESACPLGNPLTVYMVIPEAHTWSFLLLTVDTYFLPGVWIILKPTWLESFYCRSILSKPFFFIFEPALHTACSLNNLCIYNLMGHVCIFFQ